jgi:hypothetical protein
MKRDEALRIIRQNRATLENVGVAHAYLFGSVARDEADADSDIDVMIDVAYEPFTLFGIARVLGELEDMLNSRVDVVIRADALEGKNLHTVVPTAINVF